MRIRVYIGTECTNEIKEILDEWGGKYELSDWGNITKVYFYIFEDDIYYNTICDKITMDSTRLFFKTYSEEERCLSEWLTIRATTQTLDLKREEELFEYSCEIDDGNGAYHRKRSGNPIYMSKIRWSTRKHFNSSYQLGMDHLFCDEMAKQVLSQTTKGISFENILHWKTGERIDNIYILNFTQRVKKEDILLLGPGISIVKCPLCGRITYNNGQLFTLSIKAEGIPKEANAFCTEAIFGSRLETPINIISQGLYRLIRENNIDRGLEFEPVQVI